LYLIWKILELRREREALFRSGAYLPLKVHGEQAERVCAFARHGAGETLLVIAPRLVHGLPGEAGRAPVGALWGDTWVELPPERAHAEWTNVLTGECVPGQLRGEAHGLPLTQVFETIPYAMLHTTKEDQE
jgi:(1->4)-alpha-D-glucan 1-alpha-D-glucosylmutase